MSKEEKIMSKIMELREKRAKVWEQAKAFLDERRGEDDLLSAEDAATYEKMEEEVVNLGNEIERLERQAALDLELSQATSQALRTMPGVVEERQGRATDEYTKAFWKHMRNRGDYEVRNALTIGTDSEGGYLVPDEFERTLVEALEEENIMRQLAKVITTSSGDKKIPVVASKGTAAWVDEEGAIPEDDDVFGQVSIGAYKVATMIKVSEELLNDSIFNLESYIAKEFARRIGAKEEEAFLVGDGGGKPAGIFDDTYGGEIGANYFNGKY
jgi:HK97 family phage major capsid protein